MGKESKASDEECKPSVAKSAVELQRFKLEKLMKNPDKPVVIPERVKEKKVPHVPEFVRNVMGSSAGAGSGEFHVYRHLRRKEYARQKFIQEKSEKELLEEAYHQKLLDNKMAAEEKTAKKRAKRLKKKAKKKFKKSNVKHKPEDKNDPLKDESTSEEESESNEEQESSEISKTETLKDVEPKKSEVECFSDSQTVVSNENNTAKCNNLISRKDLLDRNIDHNERSEAINSSNKEFNSNNDLQI